MSADQRWSKEDEMVKSWLAKHQWDNTSVEAEFHKRLGFLSKKHQGMVMHHFREVLRTQLTQQAKESTDG